MKAIQPISLCKNGSTRTANTLNLYVVNDDLKSSATFYYALLDKKEVEGIPAEPGFETPTPAPAPVYTYETLADGNLSITGDEYNNWNSESDINGAAYEWAANKLGLTLTLE
jgi:hypothetical protein